MDPNGESFMNGFDPRNFPEEERPMGPGAQHEEAGIEGQDFVESPKDDEDQNLLKDDL